MGLRDIIRDISNLTVPGNIDRTVQSHVEAVQSRVGAVQSRVESFLQPFNGSGTPVVPTPTGAFPTAPLATTPPTANTTDCLVPRYNGRYLFEWIDDIKALKRAGDLDQALALAQACLTEMVKAALQNPQCVLEYYVAQVTIIQHKMKDYSGELATLDRWFSLGLPAPREDYRIDLQKRRAKAQEMLAKQRGEDASSYNAEWKRLVELEKHVKNTTYFDAPTTGYTSITGEEHSTPRNTEQHSSSHRPYAQARSSASARAASSRSEQRRSSAWSAPSKILAAPTFVAVDFETANRMGGVSACQIALVKVHQGQVIDRMSTLIKPPSGYDHFEFTDIHGITARDVHNSPSWTDVAPYALRFSAGLPMYAHNAAFDKRVWQELDEFFRTQTLPSDFFCSYRTAKDLVPGLSDYKLPTVTRALVPGFRLNHHDATSDAEACALIVAALQQRNRY